jgi:hypothetical protein
MVPGDDYQVSGDDYQVSGGDYQVSGDDYQLVIPASVGYGMYVYGNLYIYDEVRLEI